MPFDPTLPADNSPMSAPEMRAQLNSLKELIDTLTTQVGELQTELASIPPGTAQIIDAQSPDPGVLIVTATAPRALEISVLRKGPSDPDFVAMGNIIPGGSAEETGLESGTHTVKAFGFNAGGNGPESATVDVEVT